MGKNLLILGFLFMLCACDVRSPKDQLKTAEIKYSLNCCSPEILDTAWYTSGRKAPQFSGLAGLHFPVTTRSKDAQRYFDQGLMLSFGFNHAEAARSFFEATRQDSSCAMCWWGFSYVLGPNYNAGMEKDNFKRANDALQKAKSFVKTGSQKERDLVAALVYRYAEDTTRVRSELDSAYADAMRKVYQKHAGDATIAALFAESLMDCHPWNLYQKDGTIQPWTPEILTVLERCLKQEPRHAGANHFYIHATEMSTQAEKALPSANLLRDLVPGSGHLVHMPSHTYIRIGQYHDGVLANQKAVLVDSLYMEACHAQGVYPLAYYPHNHHFIAACATLSGESKIAMVGAMATSNHAHMKLMRDPAWATLQHYYAIPYYVQVKLGMWNDVASSKMPDKDLKYPSVIWHYAQGMANLHLHKTADAKKHLTEMNDIMRDTSIKALTIWGINSVYDLCEIATKVLSGEINAAEKNYPMAISLLTEAVAKEDNLNYDEPPDWFFSVRHHLGAVLLEARQYDQALRVYEADLKNYRDNGWALAGMMIAYEKLGQKSNYVKTKSRFEQAWKHSDIKITTSRLL